MAGRQMNVALGLENKGYLENVSPSIFTAASSPHFYKFGGISAKALLFAAKCGKIEKEKFSGGKIWKRRFRGLR